MHLLTTSSATLDDIVAPVDLGQSPGDVVVLSFADSDLAALAAAWAADKGALPSLRLVQLRELRHPLSVDLWIDKVAVHAKVIVVRLLGGLDWWRYGVEQLAAVARTRRMALALLPGEGRDDRRLVQASTLTDDELTAWLAYFREGGPGNLRALLRRLARHAGVALDALEPQALPRFAAYLPGEGTITFEQLLDLLPPDRPKVAIIFYRAALLAADVAPIDKMCAALRARGLAPAPLVVTSLKDNDAAAFVRDALSRLAPALIITTTAFATGTLPGEPTPLDGPDVPVLQAVIATTARAAWHGSARGLGAADLAMHVVLPELDGRVLAGAIAFKQPRPPDETLAFTALANAPEPDRIDIVADRAEAIVRLQTRARAERRVAVLLPDYPGAPGRTAYAVGLDVPASVVALLHDLAQAGYTVSDAPANPSVLIEALMRGSTETTLSLEDYGRLATQLPADAIARITQRWGEAAQDPDVRSGAFVFRARVYGHVLV